MYVQCLDCGTMYEHRKKDGGVCPECGSDLYKMIAVSNEEIAEDNKREK